MVLQKRLTHFLVWVTCDSLLRKRMVLHSHTHQPIKCKHAFFKYPQVKLWNDTCLQKSPRGGRVSLSGPRTNSSGSFPLCFRAEKWFLFAHAKNSSDIQPHFLACVLLPAHSHLADAKWGKFFLCVKINDWSTDFLDLYSLRLLACERPTRPPDSISRLRDPSGNTFWNDFADEESASCQWLQ